MTELIELQERSVVAKERAVQALERLEGSLAADAEIWLLFFETIATNYMKPTTATLPESVQADASRDARYVAVACDALLAEFRNRFPE